jgi:hypothetical protein
MAKKKEAGPRKYEVLEPSYIDDRIYQAGEHVEYEGRPGPNLRLLEGQEAYEDPDAEPDTKAVDLDVREKELNLREDEIAKREKDVDAREQQLDQMIEDADGRAKYLDAREQSAVTKASELDAREKDVAAKEAALVDKAKK